MQAFYDLKIATKLIVGFVSVLLLTAFLGLFSISQLAKVNTAADEIGNDWMPSAIEAMGMKESMSRMRSQEAQLSTAESPEEVKKYQDRTNEAVEQFRKHHTAAMKYVDQPGERKTFDEALSAFNEYVQISTKIGNFAREGNSAEAIKILRTDSSKSNKKLRDMIDKIADDHIVGGQKAFAESSVIYKRAQTWVVGVIIAAIIIGLVLATWLARIVSAPLKEAVEFAEAIAHGDLTRTVVPSSSCETGQLIQALSDMNTSLLQVVAEVRTGTDQINHASAAIAAGNLDLSSRTEEQAGSLEETASSMEEITATIKHNSDNARQANILSQSATAVAVKGGSVVSEVVATMTSINESSRKIVDIISVIDGIAFQTNILALNAAVEAARAGEQGRGFAVVASEVRSLAQRSASAAKEIKELINDSVEKVGQGSKLVDSAGSTMQEVVDSVKRVSDMISEITAAGQEQSTGIDQINTAIIQMDNVTQQNAALVEEAAAAAATLQEQAENLVKVVSVFKLDNNTFNAPPPRPAARSAPPAKRSPASMAAPRIKAAPAKAKNEEAQDWEEF